MNGSDIEFTDYDAQVASSFAFQALHQALVDSGVIMPGVVAAKLRSLPPQSPGVDLMVREHIASLERGWPNTGPRSID
jgi:hypothetical protein